MKTLTKNIAIVSLLVASSFVSVLVAGPLNPPPGPITSTYKTLTEVEPRIAINATNTPGDADSLYKITQPGSYYLTGNITGVAGKHGIEIASGDVTIDLNGYTLQGVPGSLDGVHVFFTHRGIVLTSGNISGWGRHGVNGGTFNAGITIRRVRAANNTNHGFFSGATSVFEDCVASENGQNGFDTTSGTAVVFARCEARSNTGNGFTTSNTSHFDGCLAFANSASGFDLGPRSYIQNCLANSNTLDGIVVSNNCTVKNNTCTFNGNGAGNGAGIHVTSASNTIVDNMCTSADRGIDVDVGGNFIARNTCSANATNWDVVAGNKCLVVNGVNAGAILGNSGGVSPGSTDPNANFTY